MSVSRSRISVAAMVSASVLAGLSVAESSGATSTPDTVAESTVAVTPETAADTSITTTAPAAIEILPPDESWRGLTRGDWLARKYQWVFSLPDDVSRGMTPRVDVADTASLGPSSS
jgi:hypothetical protein